MAVIMNIEKTPSFLLSFKRDPDLEPSLKADFWERTGRKATLPLNLAFGRSVVVTNDTYTAGPTIGKIRRVGFGILSVLTFPLALVGMLALVVSRSQKATFYAHRAYHYKTNEELKKGRADAINSLCIKPNQPWLKPQLEKLRWDQETSLQKMTLLLRYAYKYNAKSLKLHCENFFSEEIKKASESGFVAFREAIVAFKDCPIETLDLKTGKPFLTLTHLELLSELSKLSRLRNMKESLSPELRTILDNPSDNDFETLLALLIFAVKYRGTRNCPNTTVQYACESYFQDKLRSALQSGSLEGLREIVNKLKRGPIEHLNLDETAVNAEQLTILCELDTLKRLSLKNCRNINAKDLYALTKLTCLEHLHVEGTVVNTKERMKLLEHLDLPKKHTENAEA